MILIFDVETTGLPLHPQAPLSKQPKIIELGAVLLDEEGNEVESFCEFINPGEPITAEITKITGITDLDVVDAPTFRQLLPRISELFAKAETVCAHNLPFDKSLLYFELRRIGMEEKFPWPKKELCTIATYSPDWGRMPKLTELYLEKMGKPLEQTHRAEDDCRALAEIVIKERLYELA